MPTSGFQPLYFLCCLPVLHFSPRDPIAPIHAMECVLAIAATATTLFAFLLGRRLHGPGTGLLLAALATISPAGIAHGMNGLETGLALLFAGMACWSFVREVPQDGVPSVGGALRLGGILGLAFLARVDLGLLAGSLLAVAALRALRARRTSKFVGRAALLSLAGGVVVGPWIAFSLAECGDALPASGAASRQIARNYGWANLTPIWPVPDGASPLFDPDDPPARWTADVATKLCAVFVHEHPLLAAVRIDSPFSVFPAVQRSALLRRLLAEPRAFLAILAAAVALAVLPGLLCRGRAPGIGAAAALFVTGCALGYTFYAPVHWYFPRYLAVPAFVSTAAVVAGFARLCDRRGLRTLGVVLAVTVIGSQGLLLRGSDQPLRRLLRDEARPTGLLAAWIGAATRLPEDQVLGAFQAGTYAWFGQRDVVNLDGKVDARAAQALREHRLHEYLVERGVDRVFDWEWIFHCLCGRYLGAEQRAWFRPLFQGPPPEKHTLFAVRPPKPARRSNR